MDEQRFEFVLCIKKHIICQRYFSIRDYNEDSLRSLELKEMMDRLVGMNNGEYGMTGLIPTFLKDKAIYYLFKNYHNYYPQKEETFKNIFENDDNFIFEIKVDGEVVASSCFPTSYFPKQSWDKIETSSNVGFVYQLNIKELIPTIISEIKDTLTKNKYTKKYGNLVL